MSEQPNRRILVVDDNHAIHADFQKLLRPRAGAAVPVAVKALGGSLEDLASDLFGAPAPAAAARPTRTPLLPATQYEVTDAFQGQEALELVRRAVDEGRPFALAFVDVRMPPGWDGIETLERLWEVDPELEAVICTAFADYSYAEIVERLGAPHRYLILKKPFDGIEVQQLAATLTAKWHLERQNREQLDEIRAYATSLEAVNQALAADKRLAEERAVAQAEFLLGAGLAFRQPADELVRRLSALAAIGHEQDLAATLGEVERSASELAAGLLELAELSAAQAGRLELHRQTVNLAAHLTRVAERGDRRCRQREHRLQLVCEGPLPETVELDPERLDLALDALIAWGLERAQGPELRLSAVSSQSPVFGTPELSLELSFDGAPLSAEERETLFLPFQAARGGPECELALPLVRQLAQLLDGQLDIECDRAGHTCLRLRLDPGAVV